jgi:hypothetical protein
LLKLADSPLRCSSQTFLQAIVRWELRMINVGFTVF